MYKYSIKEFYLSGSVIVDRWFSKTGLMALESQDYSVGYSVYTQTSDIGKTQGEIKHQKNKSDDKSKKAMPLS